MLNEPLTLSASRGRVRLSLGCTPLGQDLCITLTGGDREHIGSVALAQRDGTLRSLTVPHHREEDLARLLASRVCSAAQVTVTAICGIHLDHIEPFEIQDVLALAETLTDQLIGALSKDGEKDDPPGPL